MNKEILYEILNSKSETLSSTEIENIMNEELDKSTQDMDTDLIDLCLEALNTVDEEKFNKRKKKYRFGRIVVAAAIFVLVIGITIPVCAKYLSINVPEGIVTIYKECFNVDILNDKYIEDIVGTLERDGMDEIILPNLILESSTKTYNYTLSSGDDKTLYGFDFSDGEIDGHVAIEKYTQNDFSNGKNKVSSEFEQVDCYIVDGIDVLVFSNADDSYIQYTIKDTEYSIFVHCDYDTACQMAKTL